MNAIKKTPIFQLLKSVQEAPENLKAEQKANLETKKVETSPELHTKDAGSEDAKAGGASTFDAQRTKDHTVPAGSNQSAHVATQSPMNMRLSSAAGPQQVLNNLTKGLKDLKATLTTKDLPPWMGEDVKETMVQRVMDLDISPKMDGLQFGVSVDVGSLQYGEALLKPMTLLAPKDQVRLGHLMVLHEVYHSLSGLHYGCDFRWRWTRRIRA